MFVIGALLMFLGVSAIVTVWNIDISAPGSTMVNLGLMIRQQNMVIVSGFILVVGACFVAASEITHRLDKLAKSVEEEAGQQSSGHTTDQRS